jgi:FixJ family two-component response regulator
VFAYQLWNKRLTELPLIAIVDDDDMVRAAIESLVRSLGMVTRTFASAESFLQSSLVREARCLILDVQMPNMSGLELQDRLSRLGVDLPIIFVTAYPDETVKARALEAGAFGFMQKPLDLRQPLADCLSAALNRHKRTEP